MRSITLLLAIIIGLTACQKDTTEVAQDVGVLPQGCGSDGARLQATVDGNSYCASAQVVAVGEGFSVTVTGVDLTGNTIILQADSIGMGTQPITEANNGILLIQNGTTYVVLPGNSGTLHITEADTTAHVFKASFDVTLQNDVSGQSRAVQGSLDVVYTEEQ